MYLAVDCETTGLDVFKGDRPFMYTAYDGARATAYYSTDGIRDLCADEALPKVMFNAKFDIAMFESAGIEFRGPLHDVLIMAHVFNPDEPVKKLKVLAKKYLGIEATEEQDLKAYMRKHKLSGYHEVPRSIMEPYALNDAEITWKLFMFYKDSGVLESPTYSVEMRLLKCMLQMYSRGVLIDRDYCETMSAECGEQMEKILHTVEESYGDINISSNKQLGKFLFEEEGLTCEMISDKGNPVLDVHMLSKYEHDIIPLVLRYRELAKIDKTYLQGLIEKCDSNNVVHCDYFQVGAKTGRCSCSNPNLMNIPQSGAVNIRRAFICRPGYSNLYLDYSQVELRILAHYSNDERMMNALLNGDDLHGITAEGIFGKDYTKRHRFVAKRINFGIVYGVGPKKFTEILAVDCPEEDYSYSDAFSFINGYHRTYPKIKPFIWQAQRMILERGYVFDIFGRKYPCSKDMAYKAVNYLIQGCAAGAIKNAMIRVADILEGTKSSLLLTIHDELVVEIHESERHLIPLLITSMEDHTTFKVPLIVNASETATSWDQKQELPKELQTCV